MPIIFRKNVTKNRTAGSDIHYPIPQGVAVSVIVEGIVKGSNVPIHKHEDEEHYWILLEGSGRVLIGEEEFDVEPGDVIITPPGIMHCIWSQPETIIRVLEWSIKRARS
jgi:quercetin dioxygenase-like cupin family protein